MSTKPAGGVVVGDKIASDRMTDGGNRFSVAAVVTSIGPGPISKSGTTVNGITTWIENTMITITTNHPKYGEFGLSCTVDHLVRVYGLDHDTKIAEALEYQATLTKQGKPRKS